MTLSLDVDLTSILTIASIIGFSVGIAILTLKFGAYIKDHVQQDKEMHQLHILSLATLLAKSGVLCARLLRLLPPEDAKIVTEHYHSSQQKEEEVKEEEEN